MKLILSTSNLMGGWSVIRHTGSTKSNQELVSALRSSLETHILGTTEAINGKRESSKASNVAPQPGDYKRWTRSDTTLGTLEVPALAFEESGLEEERDQYDITLKLFFLPGSNVLEREAQIREAFQLVSKELHMPSIDLLILCFPGIYFDEGDDAPERVATRGPIESEPEALADQIATWRVLEQLHKEGLVRRLGVAEFGHDRLKAFLSLVSVRPNVDQINLRDCCSVPKDLLALAKSHSIELLVHNDCSNILPKGTIRELLGPDGAFVLAASPLTGTKRKNLHGESTDVEEQDGILGEVRPQWVVKYTAVIRNRGVVENKGYFAVAEVVQ